MASFLRKLVDVKCRSGNVVCTSLRSCHIVVQSMPSDDRGKQCYIVCKTNDKNKRKDDDGLFKNTQIQPSFKNAVCDGPSEDLDFAQKLYSFVSALKPQIPPQRRLESMVEFCCNGKEQAYKGTTKENVYLWCSGVFALSGLFLTSHWQRKERFKSSEPILKLSPSVCQALKDYFWGLPVDHIILSVNAKPTEATTNSTEKGNLTKPQDAVTDAAHNFKQIVDDSVSSVLNTLAINLSKSKQNKMASMLFEKAASHGDAAALYNLGICYEHGQGVKQSFKEAVKFYKLAAEKGHSKAMFNLASLCLQERKLFQEESKHSIKWMEQAARHEIVEAQKFLGLYFANQKDWKKATEYFKMGAEKGDPVSQYHLGICFERGLGLDKNLVKAGNLYLQAAHSGHKSAQFNSGAFFEKGLGGFEQSSSKAIEWYSKAYNQGDSEAKHRIDYLKRNLRNTGAKLRKINGILQSPLPTWQWFTGEKYDIPKSWSSPNLLSVLKEKSDLPTISPDLDAVLKLEPSNTALVR